MVVINDGLLFVQKSIISILALFLVLLDLQCEVSRLLFQPTNLPLILVYLPRGVLVLDKEIVVVLSTVLGV